MSLQTITASPLEKAIVAGWNPVCHITYNRDAWVKLLKPLSDYAFTEAKLLCPSAPTVWSAWVPDHGVVELDCSEFYC